MSRRVLAATAFALLVAGCGSDPAGPDGFPLVGRFGNPDAHVELLAVRGGADLNFPCGEYFTSPAPIILRFDQTFQVEGRWHPATFGGPGDPRDAVLAGAYVDGRLTVTLAACARGLHDRAHAGRERRRRRGGVCADDGRADGLFRARLPVYLRRMSTDHESWLHHLADEADAAFLYRELSRAEKDEGRSRLYLQLAEVEDRHVAMWRALLAEQGHDVPVPPALGGTRGSARGRRAGSAPGLLCRCCSRRRAARSRGTSTCTGSTPDGAAGPTALTLARESKEHAETLGGMAGSDGRAVAQDRRRRVPPQRRLRLQRRPDRQLRPRGRHDRRADGMATAEPRGARRRSSPA